jgi:hypothetical protein
MATKKKKPDVYTFGMDSVESRIKTFKARSNAAFKHSQNIMKAAELEKKRAEERHEKYEELGEALSDMYFHTKAETNKLRSLGKERIDGKRAQALLKRGLGSTFGIMQSKTLLYCTNDDLELKEMYWANTWAVTMLEDLTTQITVTEMSRFYDLIEKYKGNKNAILDEAGLIVLGKQ